MQKTVLKRLPYLYFGSAIMLEGLGGAGGGVWNSLISKNLAHYSLSLNFFAYSLKIIHYSLKC